MKYGNLVNKEKINQTKVLGKYEKVKSNYI